MCTDSEQRQHFRLKFRRLRDEWLERTRQAQIPAHRPQRNGTDCGAIRMFLERAERILRRPASDGDAGNGSGSVRKRLGAGYPATARAC